MLPNEQEKTSKQQGSGIRPLRVRNSLNDESKVVTASRLAIRLQLWATREEDQVSKIQPEFSYCIWRNGNVVIVALRGHLGRVAATELAPELEKLLNDGVTSVLFDCHDLDFTGLHGYKIVLAVARGLQRRKGCFGVYNVDPDLKGVFELACMVNQNIRIFDSRVEALRRICK